MGVRSFVVGALVALVLVAAVPAASTAETGYVPPVAGPLVDGWDPPSSRYGPGNRGVDLAAAPGEAVRASASGTVTFAGRIGSAIHVVVLHDDGLRTSYSFLAATTVRRGEHVEQGDVVGRAAGPVHFGVRAGDEYLDPMSVLGGGPPAVHLVPADRQPHLTEAQERGGLLAGLAGLGGRVIDAASWVTDTETAVVRLAASYGWDVTRRAVLDAQASFDRLDVALRALGHIANVPFDHGERMDVRERRVLIDQRDCTPADVEPHAAPASGHMAVLVGGLGSSTGHAAVLDVDTRALGYADEDVTQFSYAGVDRSYDREDTFGDLTVSGERLRQLLADIARTHPGVPVDVIAHSQGGIVARAALHGADLWSPELPVIANVITLGTPHHGAVAATGAALVGGLPVAGPAVLGGVQAVTGGEVASAATSTQQLASSSELIGELDARSLPAGTRVTSIAASGDLIVDPQMSAVDGATNAIVPIEGITAHDQLPDSPATHREIALALSGMGTTCRDLTGDLALARAVHTANHVPWAADLARMRLHPTSPVESSTAPSGIRPPG